MHPNDTTEGQQQRGAPLAMWELLLAAFIGAFTAARWALAAGKGIGWDQKNYHFYNVYAWLAGRMDYHLAPAGQHSWINPLLYVPHYWLIHHASPQTASAVFAATAGLNFGLLYALARLILKNASREMAAGIALAGAAVGCLDPLFIGELGTTDSDGVVSLPVLAALGALCWACDGERSEGRRRLALAAGGFLLGMAAGLKWTCFVYAAAATATLLLLWRLLLMNRRRFLWFAGGGIAGYLPAGGYWNWLLWTRYENPFFPYWNNLFASAWARPLNFRDMRFPPQTVEAAISFPFQWFVGLHPTSEGEFRTAVFAFLSVLVPLVLLAATGKAMARWRMRSPAPAAADPVAAPRALWLLIVFGVVSYLLWIRMFAIQRYLVPLALLGGLLLWLTLDYLVANRPAKLLAFLFLAGFSISWVRVESQNWRVPFGTNWFEVALPEQAKTADTLFVMLGGGPMGYLVPYFPESARVVRLIDSVIPEDGTPTVPARRAEQMLLQHRGPLRSLSVMPLQPADYEYLKRFGLMLVEQDCVQFRTAVDQVTTCAIQRHSEPVAGGSPP